MSSHGNRPKYSVFGTLSAFAVAAIPLIVPGIGLGQAYAQSPLVANSGQLTSALGALNAAHANSEALANAAPQSEVGKIAAYDKAMLVALALPTETPTELAYRDQQITSVRATYLAAAANKPLSPTVVAKVDNILGLPASDPALGVVDTTDTLHGVGRAVEPNEDVIHANIDRPSIDRPHISRPNIQHPDIQRPDIERPQIPH